MSSSRFDPRVISPEEAARLASPHSSGIPAPSFPRDPHANPPSASSHAPQSPPLHFPDLTAPQSSRVTVTPPQYAPDPRVSVSSPQIPPQTPASPPTAPNRPSEPYPKTPPPMRHQKDVCSPNRPDIWDVAYEMYYWADHKDDITRRFRNFPEKWTLEHKSKNSSGQHRLQITTITGPPPGLKWIFFKHFSLGFL